MSKNMGVRLSDEVHKELKIRLAKEEKSFQEVAESLIKVWLKDEVKLDKKEC